VAGGFSKLGLPFRFENKDMEFIEWLSNWQLLDQEFYNNYQL